MKPPPLRGKRIHSYIDEASSRSRCSLNTTSSRVFVSTVPMVQGRPDIEARDTLAKQRDRVLPQGGGLLVSASTERE